MSEADGVPWRTGQEPDGATPLSEDEKDGLRLSWVATRGDLNVAEAANIATALGARAWHRRSADQLLDDLVLRRLHRAMFGDVRLGAGFTINSSRFTHLQTATGGMLARRPTC